MTAGGGRKDFFISYSRADRAWAEWIAWILYKAEYSVVLQAWDFRPGSNFVLEMQQAAAQAERTIAVLSPAYLASRFTAPEWAAAFAKDPTGRLGLLLPVRVRECELTGLLPQIVYIDLLGLEDRNAARDRLLAGVRRDGAKPTCEPTFPGSAGPSRREIPEEPRFPGALPAVWNLPRRNPHFTGRQELIDRLHRNLTAGRATALTQTAAVHGLGGVGKTDLATEYAYHFKDDYDVGWWLRAEDPALLAVDCMALARALRLDEKDAPEQAVVIAAVRRWLETHDRWLLIYDNAEEPKVVCEALPRVQGGHVLITSRNPAWGGIATTVPLDRWHRAESIRFLEERHQDSEDPGADRVADALGDLPLALEQAAAYCEQTEITLTGYADLLGQGYGSELWREPRDLERTVAAVWEVSFGKVTAESPAGAALLNLCAFFAPDNIPLDAIRTGAADLPEPLNEAAGHPVAFNSAIGALLRYSLVRREGEFLSVHRLVQAVTRARLHAATAKTCAGAALRLVNAVLPDPWEHTNWPTMGALLPHALATAEAGERLEVGLETVGAVLNATARYHHVRAAYAEAEPLYRRALRIRETVLGRDHPDVATSLNNLATFYHDRGRYAEAEPLYQRAQEIWKKALGPGHPHVANSLNNLAGLYYAQGRYAEAEPLYRRALKIRETVLGPEHPDVAQSLNNLAAIYHDRGRYAEAEPLYQRALKIRETVLGPDHPDVAQSLNNLATFYHDRGRYAEAEPLYRRALKIRETVLGREHPDVATSLNNLAELYRAQGRYGEAEPLHQRALKIRETVLGPDHPNVASSLNNLALLYHGQGRYAEAGPLCQRALTIRETVLGPEHPDVALSLNNLAVLYHNQGRYAEAEPLHRRALKIRETVLGPGHPDVATSLNNLAVLYDNQGRYAEAEPLYQRALEIRETVLGPKHPDVASSLNNLAGLYDAQGRYAEAEPLYQRAVAILKKALPPDHPHQMQARENCARLLDRLGRHAEAAELRLPAPVSR
ncbi:MAG: tetratricopeptide repeat protein [Rhodospirillales bacterium]|nr:tetratricopeptide repeat protein [Rhodospirillales bacterium]